MVQSLFCRWCEAVGEVKVGWSWNENVLVVRWSGVEFDVSVFGFA